MSRPVRDARRRGRLVVQARRLVQTAVLLLFLWLFLAARAAADGPAAGGTGLFFDLDPLVQVGTWLTSHELAGLSLLALLTVAATLALGRVFCGWFCPLGTLHQAVTSLRSRAARRRQRRGEATSPWQRAKYYLLVAFLVMALLGVHWFGLLDPISFLYRGLASGLAPAVQYAAEDGATAIYRVDPHLGPLHLTALSEPAYRFLRDGVFVAARQVFNGGGLLLLLLLGTLLLNLWRPRFWCRYVCPLGAMLGSLSGRPLLRLRQAGTDDGCLDCGLCRVACPAAAQPDRAGRWQARECFGCWNCVAACRTGSLDFGRAVPWRRPAAAGSLGVSRRAVLGAAAGGVGGLLLLRAAPGAQARTYNPALIRPPGARPEREFLQRCLACGLCLKACPTGGLQPAWHEAGLEGLWTPRLDARLGWCEYECNLCGQVCPTGAIRPLPLAEKKRARLGLAAFDTGRCLPYAYGRDCIVCEEHCPIPDKAIFFVEAEVRLRDGTTRRLKQPRIDPDLCTGCGICENKCVFKDRPAVHVTSAGESRHPQNQPILPGGEADWSGEGTADPYGGADPYGEGAADPYR